MRAHPEVQEDVGEWGKTEFPFGVIPGKIPDGGGKKG
jgi:hypothetical protein